MRLMTPVCRFALAAVLALAVSLPAHSGSTMSAGTTIHMTIDSSKHGQLRNIPLTSASGETTVAQSNKSAGKGKAGQHGLIKVDKEVDANSPHLQAMMTANDTLKEVVIEFQRVDKGKTEIYRTIKLTQAQITAIQRRKPMNAKGSSSSKETELITISYERMEQTNSAGGKTATDSWTTK